MSARLLQRPSGLYQAATDQAATAHEMAARKPAMPSTDLQLGYQRLRRGQLGLQRAPLHPYGLRLGLPPTGSCSCRASHTLEEVHLGHTAATRWEALSWQGGHGLDSSSSGLSCSQVLLQAVAMASGVQVRLSRSHFLTAQHLQKRRMCASAAAMPSDRGVLHSAYTCLCRQLWHCCRGRIFNLRRQLPMLVAC